MSSSIRAVDPAYGEALVPETCCLVIPSTILVEDRIRQAKAEFPLVLICPDKGMAPCTGDRWSGGKCGRSL
jgi:hypothetical protein